MGKEGWRCEQRGALWNDHCRSISIEQGASRSSPSCHVTAHFLCTSVSVLGQTLLLMSQMARFKSIRNPVSAIERHHFSLLQRKKEIFLIFHAAVFLMLRNWCTDRFLRTWALRLSLKKNFSLKQFYLFQGLKWLKQFFLLKFCVKLKTLKNF